MRLPGPAAGPSPLIVGAPGARGTPFRGKPRALVRLNPVLEARDSFLLRTIRATKDPPVRLDAVPDDPAAAVRAGRSDGMDRAFEAVEGERRARNRDLEGLVVLVPADFTSAHV